MKNRLAIMVKAPRLGAVKSRLARDVGWIEAVRFYRRATRAVLARLEHDPRWRTVLAVTPDRDAMAGFWPPSLPRMKQGGGDLGRRMDRIMRAPPNGPVVIVGSDIPALGRKQVAAAFQALRGFDAVFGPATDGGYWLVGLRRRPRTADIFQGVRWSTPHALADTIANLPPDWRVFMLAEEADVDDGKALALALTKKKDRGLIIG